MPTTTEIVETNLRMTGAQGYLASLGQIAQMGGIAGMAMAVTTRAINAVSSALDPQRWIGYAREIAEANAQFEESQRLIAGIFTTMGMARDFDQGLQAAAQTMDQITVAAARLPGEAEDYISVFQTGLTVVRQAIGGTTTEMTEFTNQATAVMSTLGVSSMETGMLLTRALASGRGQVDQQSMAFQRLLPFIQQATAGTAHQVANQTQFNALTQQQRGEVLRLTFAQEGLARMLENAGSSWGAQTGALASMARMMTRMATNPLFEAMKRWLGDFNAMFMDSEGHLTTLGTALTTIGEYLSNTVVRGVDSLMQFLAPAADSLYGVGKTILDEFTPVVESITGAFGSLRGVVREFWPMMQSATDQVQSLIRMFMAFWPAADSYINFTARAGIVMEHLMPIMGAVNRIFTALFNVASSVFGIFSRLAFSGERTDQAFVGFIQGLNVAAVMAEMLASAVERAALQVQRYTSAMAGALGLSQSGTAGSLATTLSTAITEAQAKVESRRHEAGGAGGTGTGTPPTPPGRPGPNVHQDFRYSRFDIMQRFAEGFDPDRIAVAFADDLGRLGEQRLQSGLEPVFGIR